VLVPTWFQNVKEVHANSPSYQQAMSDWQAGTLSSEKFSCMDGVLYYKGRLWVADEPALRQQMLHEFHASPVAGHSGYHKTAQRMQPYVRTTKNRNLR
jgi:hypothetical protein